MELLLGLMLVVLIVSVIVPSMVRRMDAARMTRTVSDMSAIAGSAQAYYAVNGRWPVTLDELKGFLSQVDFKNAWRKGYEFSSISQAFRVETDVPKGAPLPAGAGFMVIRYSFGAYDRLRLSGSISYGKAARIKYEKIKKVP